MADLGQRLWFLLGALVVFRIGAHIPVPGIDPTGFGGSVQVAEDGILGMLQHVLGWRAGTFHDFRSGIMPYISASIIMQLAGV